jgi:putative phosphoribosyl transferase
MRTVESVWIGPHGLPGELQLPAAARGLVIFAHGSGSSRLSPRNAQVGAALHAAQLGTLLFDLLTDAEAAERYNVFDIELLAGRLGEAIDCATARADTQRLPIGLFGASTGAAAALACAARYPDIAAVVSRGGRPDLASAHLSAVRAPTLLIVGGEDRAVLGFNRNALQQLRCEKALHVVPGATHLFEEPGTLEEVARVATEWFDRHLVAAHDDLVRQP